MEIKVSKAMGIFYSISSVISFWFLIYLYVSQKQEVAIKESLANIIVIYCGIEIFLTALMAIFRKISIEEKGCTFIAKYAKMDV